MVCHFPKSLLSKKIEGRWVGLVPAKIRLIFANDTPSKKIEGGWVFGASNVFNKTDFGK